MAAKNATKKGFRLQQALVGAPKPYLIGLTGRAGHGKDTVGKKLSDEYDFVPFSFAEPINRAVSVLFNIPLATLSDEVKKEQVIEKYGKSPRMIMQWFGTVVMRSQWGERFLVDHLDDRILKNGCSSIVVTDVRFNDEAELIKSKGGVVWKVDASQRLADKNKLVGSTVSHCTEKGIKEELIDFFIDNNGAEKHLFAQVQEAMIEATRQ